MLFIDVIAYAIETTIVSVGWLYEEPVTVTHITNVFVIMAFCHWALVAHTESNTNSQSDHLLACCVVYDVCLINMYDYR